MGSGHELRGRRLDLEADAQQPAALVELWGHTAYGSSDCVTDAVDTYLLTTKVPAKGKRCVGDYQPFVEDLVDDEEETSESRTRQQVRIPIAPARPGLR